MITFYMLQETAQVLTIDTIKLLEKPDVHEIFSDTVGLSIHLFNIFCWLTLMTQIIRNAVPLRQKVCM